jgi:hypothetical protein
MLVCSQKKYIFACSVETNSNSNWANRYGLGDRPSFKDSFFLKPAGYSDWSMIQLRSFRTAEPVASLSQGRKVAPEPVPIVMIISRLPP